MAEVAQLAIGEDVKSLLAPSNTAGYKCVTWNQSSKSNPYEVHIWQQGSKVLLGSFASKYEAAIAYTQHMHEYSGGAMEGGLPNNAAEKLDGDECCRSGSLPGRNRSLEPTVESSTSRRVGVEAAKASSGACKESNTISQKSPHKAKLEAKSMARAEGLTLAMAPCSQTGYRGVSRSGRRFEARVSVAGVKSELAREKRAIWTRRRWRCARVLKEGSIGTDLSQQSSDCAERACALVLVPGDMHVQPDSSQRPSPELVFQRDTSIALARHTALALTAAAFPIKKPRRDPCMLRAENGRWDREDREDWESMAMNREKFEVAVDRKTKMDVPRMLSRLRSCGR
ncbi:MAG: hypothetical protein SGPRY_003570 [Prymnesium sp.]